MEMSFLEDLLKRDVDQNQVNALVGSFENQLSTPPSSSKAAVDIKPNITASQQLSRTTSSNANNTTIPTNNPSSAGFTRYVKTPPVQQIPASSLKNGSPSFNTSQTAKIMATSAASQQHLAILRNNIATRSPKPASAATVTTVNSITSQVTTQVSIAPKIISNAVPIAPRIATNIGTNIMITPRHAQILMSRHLGPNAALLQGNMIAQMPGGISVVPRIPGGTIAVPPIMNTQIPAGLRPVVPGGRPNILNMTQQHKQKVLPRMASLSSQIPGTSLAQVTSNTSILPGQINYRFRQVNPNSVLPASQPTSSVNGVTTPAAAQAQAANVTMMKESVKRLKEFFQNLINLACGPNQPPEIGRMVKELVHNLMVNILFSGFGDALGMADLE